MGPGLNRSARCGAVAKRQRSTRKVEAPLLSHYAQRRPGKTIVGRRNPALYEGSMKTVSPFKLDGIVIGDIPKRVQSRQTDRAGPTRSPGSATHR